MKILVINGPNLNTLGKRELDYYGSKSLNEIMADLVGAFPEAVFTFFQSNVEGALVDEIQSSFNNVDGIVINPGGYAHSSIPIRDVLELSKAIKIEVHLSHLASRENFRKNLITASSCDGYISGFKENSYHAAVFLIMKILKEKTKL